MTLRRAVFLAFAVLVGAGCADVPSAAELEARAQGVYVLRHVAGRALPTTVREDETVRVIVEADTLFLYSAGTGMHITHSRLENPVSGAIIGGSSRRVEQIHYSMKGSAYRADFLCPPNASCIGGPHWLGILDEAGLRMVYYVGGTAPMEYERLPICMACRETD